MLREKDDRMKLSPNCPLRIWARPFGGDEIEDDRLTELWRNTLDRVKFQEKVSKIK